MICVSWQKKTLGTHTTMIYSGKERLRPPYNLSRLSHDFFKPKKKIIWAKHLFWNAWMKSGKKIFIDVCCFYNGWIPSRIFNKIINNLKIQSLNRGFFFLRLWKNFMNKSVCTITNETLKHSQWLADWVLQS